MATVTPSLAYAGVIVGRDWRDFLKIGWKGIVVSLLVIFGTFLVSGGIAPAVSFTPLTLPTKRLGGVCVGAAVSET